MLTFEHLDAQFESYATSSQCLRKWASPRSMVILAAVRHDSSGCVEDTLQLVGAPASRPRHWQTVVDTAYDKRMHQCDDGVVVERPSDVA